MSHLSEFSLRFFICNILLCKVLNAARSGWTKDVLILHLICSNGNQMQDGIWLSYHILLALPECANVLHPFKLVHGILFGERASQANMSWF